MIPGFEDGLVGVSAGDETVLKLKFPKDYHAEELKGKAVQFAVKVNSVPAKTMPEMNDEFFKLYGVSEGGEENSAKMSAIIWSVSCAMRFATR